MCADSPCADTPPPVTEAEKQLLAAARELALSSASAREHQAGAIAQTSSGEQFPGVNVHLTLSPPLSVSAEQAAIYAARSGSDAPIDCIALWIAPRAVHRPSGLFRQIWVELAPKAPLLLQRGDEEPVRISPGESLPDAFLSFEPNV